MKKRISAIRISVIAVLIGSLLLSVRLLDMGKGGWLLYLLKATNRPFGNTPSAFSVFHLCFLFLCVFITWGTVFFSLRAPRKSIERLVDPITFALGIQFWAMECYKQLFSFYVLGSGRYDFALFPFQFCSLPIYFCLLLPILPKGNAKDAGYRFLSLFGTVGGAAVMIFPSFSPIMSISLHTLIWHMLMTAYGFFLLVALDCGREWRRDLLPASGIFLVSLATATVLNVLCRDLAGFNMFYLSPYHSTHFIVLSTVQNALGWWAAVLLYAVLFAVFGANATWWIGKGFGKLRERREKRAKK